MSSRAERAEARRRTWTAEVAPLGAARAPLHAASTVEERLAALVRLSAAAWQASGQPLPGAAPRRDWPGEVFELRRG